MDGGTADCMRYLNGFILIGIALLVISIGGLLTSNRLLTEPGQQVNPYSWLLYLGAAILMLVNGGVSIWTAKQPENQPSKPGQPTPEGDSGTPTESADKR